MDKEIEWLSYTLNKYDEVIEDANLKLKNLRKIYKFDYDAMLEEKDRLEREIYSIQKAKLVPYFARIDFKSKRNNDICYIGKRGVYDFDNNIITVDWRAPISSLYYDSNVGQASYTAPEGVINGTLNLKRQYQIENSKLISYNDVDTISNDEILRPYLNVNADNRLKNIVSTIQSEQNKIIRERLGKNIVIQGVAGSGKTTVALHRIAYLVYNNRKTLKPSDYMVIGPNKFFVSYISKILPDLDVNGVAQYTLEELFLDYVNEPYKVNNSLDKLLSCSEKKLYFKNSLDLVGVIDNFFDNLEIIPNSDLFINDISILNKDKILKMYDEINKDIYTSVKSRIDRLILLISKYIEGHKEKILSNLIKKSTPKRIIDEFKNNILNYIKRHFTTINIKTKDIYINILNSLNHSTSNLEHYIIDIEDIPALMYIKYKQIGNNKFDNYRHIVVDEAQDYGEFNFYILKKLFKNCTFSIYGDLAQSLYSYRSIDNWDCLKEIFNNLEIQKLNKSYRTTIEIMNEANKINDILKLDRALPVIRHGENVEYLEKCNITDLIKKLNGKFKTIAVITKTQTQANEIYNSLKKKIEINLITSDNLIFDTNLNVLPSYLSKGLEFDAVIIIDNFLRDNRLDLKLLYVSITRALHKLYIVK